MRSKNSRTITSKPGRPTVAPEITFIQILGGGEYVRVLVPSTGMNVHGRVGSDAVRAALVANVADGFGERMLSGVPDAFPEIRELVRSTLSDAVVAA